MFKEICKNQKVQDQPFCGSIAAILAALVFALLIVTLLPGALMAAQDQETFPVKKFDNGKARFYKYESAKGLTIKYFVLKSSDGVVRAAFDACDVCWPSGKGYVQDGDVMVCRNCGRRFPSYSINEVQGGCNPAPLTRTIVGDQLVIKHSDLEKGAGYFNFSR